MKSAARKFVVQEHTRGGEIHWDLMLESGNVLETWRINIPPERIGNEPASAEKIFDHEVKFLTYQGIVNQGQGAVAIVDSGIVETLEETQKTLRLRLHGKILLGEFALEHIEHDRWRLLRVRDV